MGQSRRFCDAQMTSAFPSIAAVFLTSQNFSFFPTSETTTELRIGAAEHRSGGVIQKSTFAKFLASFDFRLLQHYLPGPDILGKMLPPQGIGHVAQSLDSVNSCKYPSPTPLRSSSDFSF